MRHCRSTMAGHTRKTLVGKWRDRRRSLDVPLSIDQWIAGISSITAIRQSYIGIVLGATAFHNDLHPTGIKYELLAYLPSWLFMQPELFLAPARFGPKRSSYSQEG